MEADSVVTVFKLIVSLVAVILLLTLFLRYLNRLTTPRHSQLAIIQKIMVSKAVALAIVKIMDSYYVMTISDQSSTVIKKLSTAEADQLNAQPGSVANDVPIMKDWPHLLQQALKKGGHHDRNH